MTNLETLLESLSYEKERLRKLQEQMEAIKGNEADLRKEILGYMIDENIPSGTYAGYTASRKRTKKYTVDDEPKLVAYLVSSRPELLKADLVATKKEIGKDPMITDRFIVSEDESLIVSEVKEMLENPETPEQFRERVRSSREHE